MKLIEAQVTNYRCIDDSTSFSVAPVTCLVGKNEAGKTALLKALEWCKPFQADVTYDKSRDYPRKHLTDFAERHPDGDAAIVRTKWQLEPADVKVVEDELGLGFLKVQKIEVTKKIKGHGTWEISVDETKTVGLLIASAALPGDEKETLSRATTTTQLAELIKALATPSEAAKKLLGLVNGYRDGRATLRAIDILNERIPKFMYFASYDRMNGKVAITKLQQMKPIRRWFAVTRCSKRFWNLPAQLPKSLLASKKPKTSLRGSRPPQ